MSFRPGGSPNTAITPGGTKVHLIVGCLTSIKAAVIVNTTRHDVHLSGGGVSTVLARAAGATVQAECTTKAPNGIATGDILETGAGNLTGVCAIYHGAFNGWDGDDGKAEKAVAKFIPDVLAKASSSKHKSLALPVIGTGILKYPHARVAKVILDGIIEHCSSSSGTTLENIYVAIYDKDTKSKEAMEEELNKRLIQTASVPGSYLSGPRPGSVLTSKGIVVHISVGSIVNEQADVFINTTNHSLDLSCAGLSAIIVGAAGATIQDECSKEAPGGIQTGDIVETSAGNLNDVRVIYHGAFDKWDGDNGKAEKAVRSFFMKSLIRANSAKYTSLAVPAIGTGILNYPHKRVARLLLDVIEEFSRNTPLSKLKLRDICISIYDKDIKSQTAFKSVMENVVSRSDVASTTPVWQSNFLQDSFGKPDHWEDMSGSDVKCVVVKKREMKAEYSEVEKHFKMTLKDKTIKKIQRVQNPYLYRTYMLRKQKMRSMNQSTTSYEQFLFHGTSKSKLTEIIATNFNRSYAGDACAARLGEGVYFAKDASFSHRYTKDNNGTRYMYRAKVLVGEYAEGDSGIKVPPTKPNSTVRYDSVVDNVQNPCEFVIFHDDAVYPEYIISYADA